MNPPEAYSTEVADDELDLSRYLRALLRWWRLIVLCAALGALAALAASQMTTNLYQTEASLAILRAGTIVNFDSNIRMVSDTDPNAPNPDILGRRKSLVTLGTTPELAQAVVNEIGSQLPERFRDPAVLARIVKVRNDGDLIFIQVTSVDPAQAALVANTWARIYQDRVNALYSENPFNPETLGAQVSTARQNYDAAQGALVNFLNTSPLEELTRKQDLLAAQLDTQTAVLAKLIQLEQEARALRERIASGSADASRGDELASLLLEASAFSTGAGLPVNVQINFDSLNSNATPAERLTQIDSLIAVVQARVQTLEKDEKGALVRQLNEVKSQIETAEAKEKELTAARDLSWTTYQSLLTQMAAANITSEAGGQVVRVATPALAPTEPRATSRLLMVLLGGVVGLLVGTVLAFVLEFMASGLSSPERVQETLQLPTLAVLPDLALAMEPKRPDNATAEELRRLRYTLFSRDARGVLAITGASSGKDASALSMQLALVTAQAGKKVLLVDANLREPLLHALFHVERTQGLAEALRAQENDIWQYAKASRVEGLSFMPAGAAVADPAALLDTTAFRALVSKLQENFEIVIFNTPPVSEVIDPVIVARATQGIVLVLDSVNTMPAAARHAKQRLDEAQAAILGVVLSHTRAEEIETPGAAPHARPRFWSGVRSRMLQLLGPRPGPT